MDEPDGPTKEGEIELASRPNKRCKVDRLSPYSSFLVLVPSSFNMIIVLAIIPAGSPVLVAGSERVVLQAGQPAVIPFDIPRFPDYTVNTSHMQVSPYSFTLCFQSKLHPFCINGEDNIKGFKTPSQLPRFSTSIAEMASSICVKVTIDPVDIVDEDWYVLRAFFHAFGNLRQETVRKEILVQIPPGPAKCFITTSENNNYPYEVHCQATVGSMKTTLTCYQYSQRVEVKHDVTNNDRVTRGVFLLPDNTPFSCCSHDVTAEVNVTMCNHFKWPPSKHYITPPTVTDPRLTPSVANTPANTIAPIGNTFVFQVDSGTRKLYTSSVSLTIMIGQMIYSFCIVEMW